MYKDLHISRYFDTDRDSWTWCGRGTSHAAHRPSSLRVEQTKKCLRNKNQYLENQAAAEVRRNLLGFIFFFIFLFHFNIKYFS